MLKATFMFWFKLESMLPSILFPPLLAGHFKKWACVALTITIYSFVNYHENEFPTPFFFKCPHLFHDSWQVSQDKKKKKSLQVFMLHKALQP